MAIVDCNALGTAILPFGNDRLTAGDELEDEEKSKVVHDNGVGVSLLTRKMNRGHINVRGVDIHI